MKQIYYWLSVAIFTITQSVSAAEDGASDEEALMALERMAALVSGAQSYSVTLHLDFDVVQEDGQKIAFSEVRELKVERPNHIRVDAVQSDGDAVTMLSDDAQITLYHERENAYSVVAQRGDVDATVRFAVNQMGLRMPLARMLLSTFATELARLTVAVDYVEKNVLGAVPTHHLAGQTPDIDYQYWIAAEGQPLPQRVVIDYHRLPGQPQFRATFTDWNLTPKFAASTFEFKPPAGAEKIPSLKRISLVPGAAGMTGEKQ